MLSQIITRSKQIQGQIKVKSTKTSEIIQQLIKSPNYQSWIYLDYIIRANVQQGKDQSMKKIIKQQVEYNYGEIKTFSMMMFLYSLQVDKRINIEHIPFTSWKNLYQQFCIKQNQLVVFNYWAFDQGNYTSMYDLIQNTLQMVAKNFDYFLTQNTIPFTDYELNSIIQWILRMRTESPQKFEIAHNLSRIIVQNLKYKQQKQHLVMKKLITYLKQVTSDSGNAFLLLQPQEVYNERVIDTYFCGVEGYYIVDMKEEEFANVFRNLTLGGVMTAALSIIEKISSLLYNREEYPKLRYIYQNFILPILTKFKASVHQYQKVYKIVQFYVVGFLKHCHIGRVGVDYLLETVAKIGNSEVQEKWINLALAVGVTNNLQDYVTESIKTRHLPLNRPATKSFINESNIWTITMRTGKEHKKYVKQQTKQYRGIVNQGNQCYIISAVQSLFLTQQLRNLLNSYRNEIKQKLPLLDELRILLAQLYSGKKDDKEITIYYLKKLGPKEFRESMSQEDTMDYLMKLFQQVEEQCKKVPGMLDKFNAIFKIHSMQTTVCRNCSKETTNIENTYIHTIPHTQLLKLKTEEQNVEDYKCDNCKRTGQCKKIHQIQLKCKIFIVHINRFSLKDGVCKKQLSNQTILRRFLNYELVGMICHCGKSINSGHYKYFMKKGEKVWVEFNDTNVWQFELEDENEQFQAEMEIDMSPYILVYRRVD